MKKLLTVALIGVCVLLMVNAAQATTTFTFGDKANYWDTWANGTADDSKDTIGTPDLLGGGGTLDDSNILTSLYIDYTGSMSGLTLGDVFIDSTSDGYWDYILSDETVYSVHLSAIKGVNDDAYVYSDSAYPSSNWTDYRNAHPYAVTDAYLLASGTAIGSYAFDQSLSKFSFNEIDANSLELDLNRYTLAVAPSCANDVLVTTPEPASMLLLGSGLAGLAGLRRKKFFNKKK